MYIYGKNVVSEYLDLNKKIINIYLADNFKNIEILEKLNKKNLNYNYINIKQMDILESGNHQGILLEIEDYIYYSECMMYENLKTNPFIVILDHIEDPHNFGAIIRTCEAAGVEYIIIPKNRSVVVNGTVTKTSSGATEHVKIVQVTNIVSTINKLKEKGIWIVGTDMNDGEEYTRIDYTVPTAIIISNESKGISKLVKKNSDFLAHIPMYGKTNSLNASVAAGIIIYEVIKQRR